MSGTTVDKFRGTLVGVLIGDCTGNHYELSSLKMDELQRIFDSSEKLKCVLQFSNDAEMTKGIAESLIKMKTLDPRDVARRFVSNYYKTPTRDYRRHVEIVLNTWKRTNFVGDLFKPATLQFDGMGSWGNGGAMRISPVSLFCCNNYDLLLEMVDKCTRLTHTHELGVNGALLQAICIYKCFHHDPHQPINADDFVQDVIMRMKSFEHVNEEKGKGLMKKISLTLINKLSNSKDRIPKTFNYQLKQVQILLRKGDVNDEEVKEKLGTELCALYSVPTALYCFLRAQNPIIGLETEDVFRRTISYCISLGGDTDTIASMAGAMCGAYLGLSCISIGLQEKCEGVNDFIKLADGLYSIQFPSPRENLFAEKTENI